MNMARQGEILIKVDGAKFGHEVWCDRNGEYDVEGTRGRSEFFFHHEKVLGSGNQKIRWKKWRT